MVTEPQSQPRASAPGDLSARHASLGEERVVLLARDGTPVGTAAKAGVHGTDTPLHLAFSCYLFDEQEQVLLTRRALGKATWPGVWSNTCCGHPQPGEEPEDAVRRRLRQELGIEADGLQVALPDFSYRAVDASGVVENEICPVWVGHVSSDVRLSPDPAEVMDTAWVAWRDLVGAARGTPQLLSPWAVLQVPQLEAAHAGPETDS
jgi:isopentenyl-diphosphate delta-isomerase type 1